MLLYNQKTTRDTKVKKKESQKGKDHDEQRFCIRIIVSV